IRRFCSSASTRCMVLRSKPRPASSASDSSMKMSTMALPSPHRWNSFMPRSPRVPKTPPGALFFVARRRLVAGRLTPGQGRPALDQGQGHALLNDLFFLVDELPLPGDDAAPAARARLLLQHQALDADRVADEDRPAKVPFT